MKKYEIMCVFAPQTEDFSEGLTEVKKKLTEFDVLIEKEEDMGVKELAYSIKKHTHARFLYFIAIFDSSKVQELVKTASYTKYLLRILFIDRSKNV